MTLVAIDRARTVQHGKRLEYFTILWNSLEAIIAIISGFLAGSVALVGFGFDSLIEVTSGVALLWRLHTDHDDSRREEREKRALQIVGVHFWRFQLTSHTTLSLRFSHAKPPNAAFPALLSPFCRLSLCRFLRGQKGRLPEVSEALQ